VQDKVLVPHPVEMVTLPPVLVEGTIVNGPVPATEKAIGAIAELAFTVWDAPPVTETVGAGGTVTVTVVAVVAVRFAPSVAMRVMVALPICPASGFAEIMQATPMPQFAGVKVTPAVPRGTSVAGNSDGLLL
jgi:hypothetical protein